MKTNTEKVSVGLRGFRGPNGQGKLCEIDNVIRQMDDAAKKAIRLTTSETLSAKQIRLS